VISRDKMKLLPMEPETNIFFFLGDTIEEYTLITNGITIADDQFSSKQRTKFPVSLSLALRLENSDDE
jgi:hypothetical protein